MKAKNKMKKYSFIVSLALALSLALSPVSAYADELDTPVHEEITEGMEYQNGTTEKDFSLPFTEYSTGFSKTLTLHSKITYTAYWEEEVAGGIYSAVFEPSNTKINGSSAVFTIYTLPQMPSHSVYTEYKILGGALRYKITITGDANGGIYHLAAITATH